MNKVLVGVRERIRCLICKWEGTISELKEQSSEFLDETFFHSCPNCGATLLMETETQIIISRDAQNLELVH